MRRLKTVPKMSFASFWARVLLAFAAAAVAAADAGVGTATAGGGGAVVGTPLTAVEGRVSEVDWAATAAAAEAEAGRAACWEGGSQFLVKTHSADGGQYWWKGRMPAVVIFGPGGEAYCAGQRCKKSRPSWRAGYITSCRARVWR